MVILLVATHTLCALIASLLNKISKVAIDLPKSLLLSHGSFSTSGHMGSHKVYTVPTSIYVGKSIESIQVSLRKFCGKPLHTMLPSFFSCYLQFLVLVMVAILRQLISEVLNRNKVVEFYDAEVIDHSRRSTHVHRRSHISGTNQDQLGHIECNCNCHTELESPHQTTINL